MSEPKLSQPIRHYGQYLHNKLWLCDLTAHGVLLAQGADVDAFLQGQLTNDLNLLDDSSSQLQGYCNPKGRLLSILRIARWQDGVMMVLPRELEDGISKRLRLYVLRADVRLTSMTDQLACLGIVGVAADALADIYGTLPEPPHGCTRVGERIIFAVAAPIARYQVIGPARLLDHDRRRLTETYASQDQQLWLWLDILAGLPTIFTETRELFVPQMTNLDILGGISFKKGCFPGQEIVARMRYLGKVKQRMIPVHGESESPPLPGEKIYAPDHGEQSAGTIVSAAASPEGGYDALAVVQRASIAQGDLRRTSLNGERLALGNLPYAIDTDA